MNLNRSSKNFRGQLRQDIVFIQLYKQMFLMTENYDDWSQLLDYLHQISTTPSINALILAGAPDADDKNEFIHFFKRIRTNGNDVSLIYRIYNFINQLILKLAEFEKFTIYIDSGKVMMSFLNIGLACDYRIFSDTAVIQNPEIQMGLPAKGGSAYFLPRLVGLQNAYKILMSEKDISAFEAIELGLINEVAPLERFEETAFHRAKEFCRNSPQALSIAKQLMYFANCDLRKYLKYEDTLLMNVIKREFEGKENDLPNPLY
jgi:enoyl-CoA hydratase/carnithine racemase